MRHALCRLCLALPFLLSSSAIGSDIASVHRSVIPGGPVTVGVLGRASSDLAGAEGVDADMTERCLHTGARWVKLSADGRALTIERPFGRPAMDVVTAAYCDDTTVILGGYHEGNGKRPRLAWLFILVDDFGPVLITPTRPFEVGDWPHETLFTLNEVRAIDAAERSIVFLGSSDDETGVLLSAPYAIFQAR